MPVLTTAVSNRVERDRSQGTSIVRLVEQQQLHGGITFRENAEIHTARIHRCTQRKALTGFLFFIQWLNTLRAARNATLRRYAANLLGTVLFNMMLGRFFCMMLSMQMMSVRYMGMMCRLFMATGGIVLGRFLVMSRRMFVMLCCVCVMFRALFAHI
jgi:hypothetical protein